MDRTKLMATLCVAVMLSAGCCVYHANVVEEDEPADAIAPVIVCLVILNGILVGYITASKLKEYINSDKDKTPGGTDRALRINQAEAVTVNLANALSHDAAYAGDEPALVAFTSSYFQRMGELAAADLGAGDLARIRQHHLQIRVLGHAFDQPVGLGQAGATTEQ